MDIIGKDATKALVPLTSLGVGILAWEYQATTKFGTHPWGPGVNFSLMTKQRFGDALAGIIGKSLAQRALGIQTAADFSPTPMGWLNKTFGAGIGIKIANAIIRKYVKAYDNLDAVPDLVDAAANGLAIGGAIGGIFDPEPSQGQSNGNGASQSERLNAVESLNAGLRS